MRQRRWARVLLWMLAALVAAAVALLTWWWIALPDADATAVAEIRSSSDVEVVDADHGVVLRHAAAPGDAAVVFYPGAAVPPEAYLPTWAPIVRATGVSVHIPDMPLRLAVLAPGRAQRIREANPGVQHWWVGGHSLGGAMATSYAGGTAPGELRGVILWAAFPTAGAGLDDRDDLTVLSIAGSRDGLAAPDDLAARRDRLPADAIVVELEGVNHAQFGRYGTQRGDGEPQVSDVRATDLIADAVTAVLGPDR